MTRSWSVPLFLLVLPLSAAQTEFGPSSNLNIQDLNAVPARAAALGSAFTGLADDASGLGFNPAGLAFLTHQEAVLFGDAGWAGSFRGSALWAGPLGPNVGAGISGTYVGYGGIEGFDNGGAATAPYGGDRFLLSAGAAFALPGRFAIGGSLRFSHQSLPDYSMTLLAPELGILWEALSGMKLGLDCIFPVLGPSGFDIQPSLRAGLSYGKDLDQEIRLLLLGAFSHEFQIADWAQAGLELGYRSTYFLRAGYQRTLEENAYAAFSEFTFGAGALLGDFRLDYAFLPSGDLGTSHRFSASFFWGHRETEAKALRERTVLPGDGGILKRAVPQTSAPPPASLPGSSAPAATGTLDVGLPADASGVLLPGSSKPDVPATGTTLPGASLPGSPVTNVPGGATPSQAGTDPKGKEGLVLEFDIPPDFVAQGESLEAAGKSREAQAAYEKAIAQDERNIQAWWKLGQLHAREGRKAEAVRCVEKALEIRPDQNALREWLDKNRDK
jgi:tetratricopeptide (TPR) repeat protein